VAAIATANEMSNNNNELFVNKNNKNNKNNKK
jgi:hypothetical protein